MENPKIAQVNNYIRQFSEQLGIPLRPVDESGFTYIARGSATLGINVFPEQNVLIFLAFIMDLPEKNQLPLFTKLLELNLLKTKDGAFAVDFTEKKIYLRALRGLEGLDYPEFVDLVRTLSEVADEWDDRLKTEFAS